MVISSRTQRIAARRHAAGSRTDVDHDAAAALSAPASHHIAGGGVQGFQRTNPGQQHLAPKHRVFIDFLISIFSEAPWIKNAGA